VTIVRSFPIARFEIIVIQAAQKRRVIATCDISRQIGGAMSAQAETMGGKSSGSTERPSKAATRAGYEISAHRMLVGAETGAVGKPMTTAQLMLSMHVGVMPLQGESASDCGEDASIAKAASLVMVIAMAQGNNCPVVTTTSAMARNMIDSRFSMMCHPDVGRKR
jgi:hypothetical protein